MDNIKTTMASCVWPQADSEPALRMLAESRHQLVMITGDAALTACHVAAQVHIVDRPVLILTHLCVDAPLLL